MIVLRDLVPLTHCLCDVRLCVDLAVPCSTSIVTITAALCVHDHWLSLVPFRAFFKNWLRPQIMPEIAHVNVVQTFSGADLPISAALETRSTRLTSSFLSHELACVAIRHTYMVLCGLPCGLLGPVRRVSLMCSKFCWYSLHMSSHVRPKSEHHVAMWLSHCGHGQEMVISQKWCLVTAAVVQFTAVDSSWQQLTAVDSSWQLTCMSFRSRTPWTKKTWLVSKNCRRSLTVTIWQWPPVTNAWD